MSKSVWQAHTNADAESVRSAWGTHAEAVDAEAGIWLVPMPIAAEARLEQDGYVEWTDHAGLDWEAELS